MPINLIGMLSKKWIWGVQGRGDVSLILALWMYFSMSKSHPYLDVLQKLN